MKKKYIRLLTFTFLSLVYFGCGSTDNVYSIPQTEPYNFSNIDTSVESSVEITPQPENIISGSSIEVDNQSENISDTFYAIDKFIDLYNTSTNMQMTSISELDIQGYDYRTEFRLNAFKNAVGKNCVVNSTDIDIVNYGTWSNDSIRFYACPESLDTVTELLTSIIHVLDNTVSDDEIKEICDSLKDNAQHILLGEGNYITGYMSTKYKDGSILGYDMMIDCSKINYLN